VTNGPFLELTVNGHQMGEELHVARGSRVDVARRPNSIRTWNKAEPLEIVASATSPPSTGQRSRSAWN